jgi:hypothetical protein
LSLSVNGWHWRGETPPQAVIYVHFNGVGHFFDTVGAG